MIADLEHDLNQIKNLVTQYQSKHCVSPEIDGIKFILDKYNNTNIPNEAIVQAEKDFARRLRRLKGKE